MWDSGWDNIFKENEWGKYPPEEVVRFISRSFGKTPERRSVAILEVGCGPGANLWYLAREGYKAFGLDGSEVAVKRARERLAKERLEADVLVGDIMTLPYPDGQFDCVLDIECLYANSMKDSKKIMNEIKRVLKPGGLFLSKTFMVGTYGDGKGKLLAGEPRTYTELSEGALHKGYGIVRFTAEEDIKELYSELEIIAVDHLIRSDKDRKFEVKEWLITCKKA